MNITQISKQAQENTKKKKDFVKKLWTPQNC